MKTIFTCGCFDLLGFRHLSFLQRAAELGDRLIVSVNSDASVKRLKGPLRPFVKEAARAASLRALRCVAEVIIDDAETPDALLRQLRPDVFVKGDGNDPHNMPGVATCSELGIEVVTLPNVVDGESTTELVRRIQNTRPCCPIM